MIYIFIIKNIKVGKIKIDWAIEKRCFSINWAGGLINTLK